MGLAHIRHWAAHRVNVALYGRRGQLYKVQGHNLRYVPGSRPIRPRYLNSTNAVNRYDALLVDWLSSHLSRGDLAVDVGAAHGTYTILMAVMCGQSGQVIAFEPNPHSRKVLEKNLGLNPGLKRPTVEERACADFIGEATLFTYGGNAEGSLVDGFTSGKTEQIRVPVVTLDSYLSGLPTPRWVKIDTEGAEIKILQGAARLLESDAGILCELHPYAWPAFGSSFEEFKSVCAKAGRVARYLDESNPLSEPAKYGIVALERR